MELQITNYSRVLNYFIRKSVIKMERFNLTEQFLGCKGGFLYEEKLLVRMTEREQFGDVIGCQKRCTADFAVYLLTCELTHKV